MDIFSSFKKNNKIKSLSLSRSSSNRTKKSRSYKSAPKNMKYNYIEKINIIKEFQLDFYNPKSSPSAIKYIPIIDDDYDIVYISIGGKLTNIRNSHSGTNIIQQMIPGFIFGTSKTLIIAIDNFQNSDDANYNLSQIHSFINSNAQFDNQTQLDNIQFIFIDSFLSTKNNIIPFLHYVINRMKTHNIMVCNYVKFIGGEESLGEEKKAYVSVDNICSKNFADYYYNWAGYSGNYFKHLLFRQMDNKKVENAKSIIIMAGSKLIKKIMNSRNNILIDYENILNTSYNNDFESNVYKQTAKQLAKCCDFYSFGIFSQYPFLLGDVIEKQFRVV